MRHGVRDNGLPLACTKVACQRVRGSDMAEHSKRDQKRRGPHDLPACALRAKSDRVVPIGERAGAVGLTVIKIIAVRHAQPSAGSRRLSPVQRWKTYASRRFFRNCQAHCGAVTATSSRPETGHAEKCGFDRTLLPSHCCRRDLTDAPDGGPAPSSSMRCRSCL